MLEDIGLFDVTFINKTQGFALKAEKMLKYYKVSWSWVVVHTFDPSPQEAEAGGSLRA